MKHFERVLSKRYARAYMGLDDNLSRKDAQEAAKANWMQFATSAI
jgi:hypothetical protein